MTHDDLVNAIAIGFPALSDIAAESPKPGLLRVTALARGDLSALEDAVVDWLHQHHPVGWLYEVSLRPATLEEGP